MLITGCFDEHLVSSDHPGTWVIEVIVAMNQDNPEYHDVYHLDLITAKLTKIAENTGNIF